MRTRTLVIGLTLASCAMFGFGYLLVPLYTVMCKAFGINGKTGKKPEPLSKHVDYSRTVKVMFLTSTNGNLPFDFHPLIKSISLHPGENRQVAFFAKNLTDQMVKVQAIPSVVPGLAAKHIKKTECFCFTQQTFVAHEFITMPVLFHLDEELPKDINDITLSYTLFRALPKKKLL